MRRLAFLAVVPVLAFGAACTASAKPAVSAKPAGSGHLSSAGAPVASGAPAASSAEQLPGVPADQLAAYQHVAVCLRGQGLTVAEPKVGVPFDTKPVSDLFDTDQAKFSKVLEACPDYTKVVIGVG